MPPQNAHYLCLIVALVTCTGCNFQTNWFLSPSNLDASGMPTQETLTSVLEKNMESDCGHVTNIYIAGGETSGPRGQRRLRGEPGHQGQRGLRGEPGPQGQRGLRGEPGLQGNAHTLS